MLAHYLQCIKTVDDAIETITNNFLQLLQLLLQLIFLSLPFQHQSLLKGDVVNVPFSHLEN